LQAQIIFTGDELLMGEVLNTHAQYLGRELAAMGIEVLLHTTVGDNRALLRAVLQNAWDRSDLLIITGGLGPTTDDLTKETVADFLQLDLVPDKPTLQGLEKFLARRGIAMVESMKKQALVPRGARVLPNPVGTAPGLLIEKDDKIVVLLPGPPRELQAVFAGAVKERLKFVAGKGTVMHSQVYKLTGLGESQVQDRLADIDGRDNPVISYVAMPGEVHVRVSARAASGKAAKDMVDALARRVEKRLAKYIFSTGDEELKEIVGVLLADRGMTVSLAESCTGGYIMKLLTDVAGSSRYLAGGVVAYSNEIKTSQLGVPRETIDRYGAVSEQTARLMAEGVRRAVGSTLGIGVTGIAGPDGGTPEKPVGLVYIALAGREKTVCRGYRFPGQRAGVRAGAANAALHMLRQYLTCNRN